MRTLNLSSPVLRRCVTLAVVAVTGAALTGSASAADVDLGAAAAERCGPAATPLKSSSGGTGTGATIDLYTYETNDPAEDMLTLCSFAVVRAGGNAQLSGYYIVSADSGGSDVYDAVQGTTVVTEPLLTNPAFSPVTARSGGNRLTPVSTIVPTQVARTPAQKKAAKKTYDKAVKKARKQYKKAGRSDKAYKKMSKAIAKAKKAYKKALKARTVQRRVDGTSVAQYDMSTSLETN
jgi:hypothetical protein